MREGIATRSEIVLSPRPEVGVLDGIALGEGSSHEVLGRAMDTDFRRHAANYTNLVRHLGGFGQILGDLIIRFGADCSPGPLLEPVLGSKVSIWLIPPLTCRKMIRLALPNPFALFVD